MFASDYSVYLCCLTVMSPVCESPQRHEDISFLKSLFSKWPYESKDSCLEVSHVEFEVKVRRNPSSAPRVLTSIATPTCVCTYNMNYTCRNSCQCVSTTVCEHVSVLCAPRSHTPAVPQRAWVYERQSPGPGHISDGWAVCGGRYYLLCERVCVTGPRGPYTCCASREPRRAQRTAGRIDLAARSAGCRNKSSNS